MTEQERIAYLEANLRDLAKDVACGIAGKIHAIKAWRAATGASLKYSKDIVEAFSKSAKGFEDSRIQRLEDRVSLLERGRQTTPQYTAEEQARHEAASL
jgi:hypothetical protein